MVCLTKWVRSGGLVAMFRDPMLFIQMRLFVLIIGCSKLQLVAVLALPYGSIS